MSLAELQTTYRGAYLRIDRSGLESDLGRAETQSPLFSRFANIFLFGIVPPTLSDADLPDLRAFSGYVTLSIIEDMLNRVRTIYDPLCTPRKLAQIALGDEPVVVRAREVTFTESEKHDLRLGQ